MPSHNDADDSIQLSFIAVDPFRKRRGRWERRQKPQDVESGVRSSDPQPSNPVSGSPAPSSRASTTPASARPPINAGQAPIGSRPTVVAHSEPSDAARDASLQASPNAHTAPFAAASTQQAHQADDISFSAAQVGPDTTFAEATLAATAPTSNASALDPHAPPQTPFLTRGGNSTVPQQSAVNCIREAFDDICADLVQRIPTEIYLCLYLRLPPSYFSRIAAIFEDSQLGIGDVKCLRRLCDKSTPLADRLFLQKEINRVEGKYPSLQHLKEPWRKHIDNLMKEWKTLNIVAGLVLTLTPRLPTWFSRFGSMKDVHMAYPFLITMADPETSVWWNVWVMLALPAIWLSWSIIAFLVSILAFVWATGTRDEVTTPSTSYQQALAPRVVISATLALGAIYFVPVIRTLGYYGNIQSRLRKQIRESGVGAYGLVRLPRTAAPEEDDGGNLKEGD
ncbi:hypothetical protein EV121DRAFT_271810 [Schizophyllum commune]